MSLPSINSPKIFLGWNLVGQKLDCDGSEEAIGRLTEIGDCASACIGISSMFIFGTNDFGTNRCYDDGCECFCETSASPIGSCNTISHEGYRLYKYQLPEPGNHQ